MTPHQETLTLAARKLAGAWTLYIEAEGGDGEEFERVAEAIGDIRAALDGRRRIRFNKYAGPTRPAPSWLPRCACLWTGSLTGVRYKAVGEFDGHRCGERGTP